MNCILKNKSYIPFLLFLILPIYSFGQLLVINELSQGTGTSEYVELVVNGTPSCTPGNCVDLRGIILDDNNGHFASGVGVGIAPGAMRFSDSTFWSCVPLGTIIVIYNESSPNSSLPADDYSMSDGSCSLILPDNSILFDHHPSQPSTSNPLFPSTGWLPHGNWNTCAMSNTGDSYQIVQGGANIFSLSWGNNTNNNQIFMTNSASGQVYYLDGSPPTQATNWHVGVVGQNETPGVPNTTANAAWISELSHYCSPFMYSDTVFTNSSCSGTCDGSASVIAYNGGSHISYLWSNGSTNFSLSSLCAGNYSVTVTDDAGCKLFTSVEVKEPLPLDLDSFNTTKATCNQSDGSACIVNVLNGTGPYSYEWSDPNNQTSSCASGLSTGNYDITISDAHHCTLVKNINILDNGAGIPHLTIDHPITCIGDCDGQLSSSIQGGNAPFSYAWSNAGNTPIIGNLCASLYHLTITDALGCESIDSVSLNNPNPIITQYSAQPESCIGYCNGYIQCLASGGTAPYNYSINNGTNFYPSGLFQNLCPNTYTFLVEDSKGCSLQNQFQLVPGPSYVIPIITPIDTLCVNGSNITLSADIPNGAWLGTGITNTAAGTFSPSIAGLGTFKVAYILNSTCTDTAFYLIDVEKAPDFSIFTDKKSGCSPLEIELKTNSNEPLNYTWDINGEITWKDNFHAELQNAGTYIINAVAKNKYGCLAGASKKDTVVVFAIPNTDFSISPMENSYSYYINDHSTNQEVFEFRIDNNIYKEANFTYNFKDTGSFEICLYSYNHNQTCKDSLCQLLEVKDPFFNVYLPNTFTPNRDNKNDGFYPYIMDENLKEYSFVIYDRWGTKVFTALSPVEKWDGTFHGTDVKQDIYTWSISFVNPRTQIDYQEMGKVLLLR